MKCWLNSPSTQTTRRDRGIQLSGRDHRLAVQHGAVLGPPLRLRGAV